MEVVAVFSVCFLMNFLGMYVATDPVPTPTAAQTAETLVKKSRIAQTGVSTRGSLLEEFMALNEHK